MSQKADLVAYSPNGEIVLIVEVKAKTKTSRLWATQMRRNLLAHGMIPNSRFFLLALPDRLYLWKNVSNLPELVEPSYEMNATPFFKPYFENAGINAEDLSSQSFELIVVSWLNELIYSGISKNLPNEQKQILHNSGLLEELKGSNVRVEALV